MVIAVRQSAAAQKFCLPPFTLDHVCILCCVCYVGGARGLVDKIETFQRFEASLDLCVKLLHILMTNCVLYHPVLNFEYFVGWPTSPAGFPLSALCLTCVAARFMCDLDLLAF